MKSPEELKILMRAGTESEDFLVLKLSLLKPIELALLKANSEPEIKSMLDNTEFTPLWVNKFNLLRIHEKSDFQFRAPGYQSKANFYCGYILYLSALKQKKLGDDYTEHLSLAISEFKSFYAYQELIFQLFIEVRNQPNNGNLKFLLNYINTENAELQNLKTPGCLLLAFSYFQLAVLYRSLNFKVLATKCYRECWTNLHLAHLLEKDSEKEIHNAYFGKGLKASNPFELGSIADMKTSFIESAVSFLSVDDLVHYESIALDIFEHKFKKSGTDSEEKSVSHMKP